MSASATTGALSVEVLLRGSGSAVAGLFAVAVFGSGPGPARFPPTSYITVTVSPTPDGMSPRVHGKPPAQGAVAETSVSPDGVGSSSTTPGATDGPTLPTVMMYVAVVPGVSTSGALLLTKTSASGTSVDTTRAMLSV